MAPRTCTGNAQMPFDDLNSTHEFPFTPSPAPQADIVWEMPLPSNPALRTLMVNAKEDSRRANPSPSESTWAFPSPAVTSDSVTVSTSTSRQSRTLEKRSTSAIDLEATRALAELTDSNYMMSVAAVAAQRATVRTKEMGAPVLVRGKPSRKTNKAEKSRGSRVVSSGKIHKRSEMKGKGKMKEPSAGAFMRPRFDDDSFTTASSSSSSTSFDASVSAEVSPEHPHAGFKVKTTSTTPSPPLSHPPRPTGKDPASIQPEKTSQVKTHLDVKLHPLLLSNELKARQTAQKPDPQSVVALKSEPSDNIQVPSLSFPKLSSRPPPVLGMRRAVTLPAKSSLSKQGEASGTGTGTRKDLPTKQRSFKTPFLPSTQRPGTSQNPSADTVPSRKTPASGHMRNDPDDGDSFDEHDSFDMDALEETLKKYD